MKKAMARVRSLLRRQSTLVLATADEDGTPRSTPLFFLADDELRLFWFSSRASRHSHNCKRDPRASIAVFRPARRWQQIAGVQIQGRVLAATDRATRQRITSEYCARFALDEGFAGVIRSSALYCFTPEWIRYIDNSEKFGEKVELRLNSAVSPSRSSNSRRRSSGRASGRRAQSREG
jgi:uncharacterized protein YhbP (UPF0306 family)